MLPDKQVFKQVSKPTMASTGRLKAAVALTFRLLRVVVIDNIEGVGIITNMKATELSSAHCLCRKQVRGILPLAASPTGSSIVGIPLSTALSLMKYAFSGMTTRMGKVITGIGVKRKVIMISPSHPSEIDGGSPA